MTKEKSEPFGRRAADKVMIGLLFLYASLAVISAALLAVNTYYIWKFIDLVGAMEVIFRRIHA